MTGSDRIMKHYNIPIFIPHLGCPYDCIYCDQKKIAAQQEIPSCTQIANTVEQHLETIPAGAVVEVAFFGGSFTAVDKLQQEQFLGSVQSYLHSGSISGIRISTRPDCINESVLDHLEYYGVKVIELGVQSLHDEVLHASGRAYKAEDVYASCRLIRERRFELGVQLMIGLPGDSYSRTMESARRVLDLKAQTVRIYPTLVIGGTALEGMWKSGDYEPLGLEEAVSTCRDMFLLFQKEELRVIRMGLYPGEELLREGIVRAGPFHPSFGELVEQDIFKAQSFCAIKQYYEQYGYRADIKLHVNNQDLSKMIGRHRKNLQELKQELAIFLIQFQSHRSLHRDWVGVSRADQEQPELILSRRQYIDSL